ncbi:hypothetical protein N752_13460 [Desulforamulus aquiferis]|nr:aminopeptidase P family N-terminal domain-containing protein [Desulforamulus aquiferis]RYD04376.1 hypothetical protein N752_13460 [Desulforamulus aquiferis]
MISKPENRSYLSGFTGTDGTLLVGPETADIFVDFRYVEQAKAQAAHFNTIKVEQASLGVTSEVIRNYKINKLYIEEDYLTVKQYVYLKDKLAGIDLEPAGGLVEEQRKVKDALEVPLIRQAMHIGDLAFSHILKQIKPGVSESAWPLNLSFSCVGRVLRPWPLTPSWPRDQGRHYPMGWPVIGCCRRGIS